MLKATLLILIFGLLAAVIAAQPYPQISAQNYTTQEANTILNRVSNNLTIVSQSSYLIFQPQLNGAYENLSLAMGNVISDPEVSVFYSNRANNNTNTQYKQIEQYKYESFPVITAFTIIMLVLLYRFMTPVKKPGKR